MNKKKNAFLMPAIAKLNEFKQFNKTQLLFSRNSIYTILYQMQVPYPRRALNAIMEKFTTPSTEQYKHMFKNDTPISAEWLLNIVEDSRKKQVKKNKNYQDSNSKLSPVPATDIIKELEKRGYTVSLTQEKFKFKATEFTDEALVKELRDRKFSVTAIKKL